MSPDTVPPPDIDAAARALGHAELHPRQRDSIDAVVSGRDVLALLASGFGKSAIYQVAASLLDGPTVVLSPLIALQRDQVDGLRRRSTHVRAVAVHSEQSDTENERSWESLARGEATIVYLTPEAASRNEVQDRLRALGVACVAVDEAHCIAARGHDFRPAYLRLGHVAEAIGRPPIIAVTATAPPPIRDEITTRLGMLDPLTVVGSFDRPEIRLSVVRHHDADMALRAAVDDVVRRSESGGQAGGRSESGGQAGGRSESGGQAGGRSESNGQAGTGLVYTATRAQAEEFAALLAERGLRALAYHAGLARSARDEAHEAFAAGTVDVVAATSAFGMGIDKPDVRFVVHTAPPDSLERYYQEFGRAGRDGADAAAVLHFRAEDLGLPSFFATRRPRPDALEAVQGALRSATEPMSTESLTGLPDLSPRAVETALELLDHVDAVHHTDAGWVPGSLSTTEAVERALEAARRQETAARSRVQMVRTYAETRRCRRQVLLEYLGEVTEQLCGRCDTCESGTAAESDVNGGDTSYQPGDTLHHRDWGAGHVVSAEADRVTVHFPEHGYRTLATTILEERDIAE
ncbi:RecQ family ATP-dependent DNA helicase [Rhodococcus sp. SORGH_AS_0301]|uniref:RecQ family ATP-dependent DNA helicase n=1 Tax=Rhodococcus sp. SORGH_AS_0301 TaxID=3041780 RepID=UPI00277F7154|nr:RecQ family ATP-dependent DNA helicase [Rhodococcus sp. SORGH_AS_0301]MDQ1181119.1 ATP-dependent DNA helicase RecQ [Rhodococcus sp. SORGH_AS_0301]